MPLSLAEDLRQDAWPETGLFVPFGRVTKSPFRAEERFDRIQHDDLRRLAFGRYGAVACLLSYRQFKLGFPYALKRSGTDSIVRYYLYHRAKYLDVEGWHTRDATIIAVPRCHLLKIDWERVIRDIQRLNLEEREYLALKRRLAEYFEANWSAWWEGLLCFGRQKRPRLPVGANESGVLASIAEKWRRLKRRRVVF